MVVQWSSEYGWITKQLIKLCENKLAEDHVVSAGECFEE